MKAFRKQWEHNYRQPCHIIHVTPAHALIWGVCILMLPVLELATEHVQLTTTCRMNPINQCPLSRVCMTFSHIPLSLHIPSLNNVLPAMVLQNRGNSRCSAYISLHSSVHHISFSPSPSSLGKRVVVVVVVLLLLLMSGDVETNPGPVGE